MKLPAIAELRNERRLSQQEVADAISVPKRTYAAWERGENDLPIDGLIKLADLFQVSTDRLLGRSMDTELKEETPPEKTDGVVRSSFRLPETASIQANGETFQEVLRKIVDQELSRRGIPPSR